MKKWLVLIGILLCFMPQVLYAGECGSMIFDQVGKLNIGKQRIEDAAKALEQDSGAVVRIHTVANFGGYTSLDGYKNHLKSTCEEFGSGLNGKMILIAISFEPNDLVIVYGDFWASELSSQYKRILKDKTRPGLRKGRKTGDYSEAFVDTLKEIGKVLKAPAPVTHVTQSSVLRETVLVPPPTVVVQKEATDMSGLWSVLTWLLVAGVSFGVGVAIFIVMNNKKKEREARSAAQRKAQSIKVQCSKLINELKLPIARSKSLVNSLVKVVDVDDIVVVAELFAIAEKTYGNATRTYTGLPSKMNPNTENLSVPEYVTIAKTYGEILTSLSEVSAKNILIAKHVADLKQRVNDAPERISAVKQVLVEAIVEITHVEESGYFVSPMLARLENANGIFNQAQVALEDRRYNDVFTFCDSAEDEAMIASSNSANLSELHENILDQILATEENLKETHEIIAMGKESFLSLSKEYLASAWMPIRGNGTEAENVVISSMQLVQRAKQYVTMNEQKWEQAQVLIEQSNALIAKARSLIHSITELKDNLDTTKVNVHREIRSAQGGVKNADEYISMYDADIDDGWWDDLARAREDLEMAKVILQDVKPDYVRAMRLATSANQSADHILDQAEDERETLMRKRRRVATLLLTAKQSVSTAEEYYEDHSSDINSQARTDIRSARSVLNESNTSVSGIDNIIKSLERAILIANRGLESAQSDVSDAQSSISGGSSTWGTSIDTNPMDNWGGGNFDGGSLETNPMNDWGGGDLGGGSIGFDNGGDLGGGSLEGGW